MKFCYSYFVQVADSLKVELVRERGIFYLINPDISGYLRDSARRGGYLVGTLPMHEFHRSQAALPRAASLCTFLDLA